MSPRSSSTLSPDLTGTLVDAVLDELAEVGYGRLSMDAVARRAKAGKSALYRRWPSKEEMVVDIVATISLPAGLHASTGCLKGDIRQILQEVHEWMSAYRMRRILPELIAEAIRNPALDAVLTAKFAAPRREPVRKILLEAVDRGEISAETDFEVVLDMMPALVFWRLCARRQAVTDDVLDSMAATIFNSLPLQSK